MRPLSHTSISTYQQCPLLYKLKYIDGRREEKKYYLSWGKSLHDALEFLYNVGARRAAPLLEKVLERYKAAWLSEGYESPEQEAAYLAEGERILTDYYLANIADFRLPVAVERKFNIDIEGIKLTGFFDRIDKLDNGTLAIVDYKSSKGLFDKQYLANDLQLTLYQLAAETLWDLPVGKLTLYHLRSNTPCVAKPRPSEQLDAARELVIQVAGQIAAENFEPTENRFCPCDFPEDCPYYRHKFDPQGQSELAFDEVLKIIDIKQTVEDYAALKSEDKEIKARIDELAETIKRFCDAERLKRVYGVEHAVTISESGRTNYDSERVKEILEPLGLWPSVQGFDPKALERLLQEGGLEAAVKEKLATAADTTVIRRLTLKRSLEEELT